MSKLIFNIFSLLFLRRGFVVTGRMIFLMISFFKIKIPQVLLLITGRMNSLQKYQIHTNNDLNF